MQLRTTIAFGVFMAACLAATAPLYGQNRGSITGTVRDATGAVLPNAAVELTDVATGVTLKTVTNAGGDYLVAGLPEATYNLKVAATGFKLFEATGIILRVGEKARVDAALEVGQSPARSASKAQASRKSRPSPRNCRGWSPERRSLSSCSTAAISRN